jgi:transcription elongation factor GreA
MGQRLALPQRESTRNKGGTLNETLVTRAGLARATETLEHLKSAARREIAERIRHAITTQTNASESADYLDAREEQALLERKIAQLEQRLAAAKIAEPNGGNGVIDVGERVRVRDLETGERVDYELVGSLEADAAAGRISTKSPVGRALLGRRKGEVAVVDVPKGTVRLKILEIELPVDFCDR